MLTDFIATHPLLAYGAVFLFALAEAVPVVGTIVPGSTIIIGLSALVPFGTLSLWPMMISAILGAIAGDGFSYWLGHRHHREILVQWPLNRYPELVAKSERFFQRHGGKSIFLGRFVPAVRAFVPLVAGILRMPAREFYIANCLSALVWAPVHILPGILLGASFTLVGAAAGRLAALLAALLVALWLVTWVVRYALRWGVPLITAGTEQLSAWARSYDTWLSEKIRSLIDPERAEIRALALCALLLLGAAGLFLGILEDVVTGDPLVRFDDAFYRALQDLRTPWGDVAMIALTELGDTAVTVPMTAIVFFWLAARREWRPAFYWVAAVGFAATLNSGIKLAIQRARPQELAYSGVSEFSFPSGHATVNAVIYGFLAFLVARQVRPAWRVPIFVAAASFATLMAFSRLYLGAHWFSDVAASLSVAAAGLIVLAIGYNHHRPPRIDVRRLAVVAFIALAFLGGSNVYRHHDADTKRYAVRYEIPTITDSVWWATEWRQLPERRIDLEGEFEEPLTFQWAGELQSLEDHLLQKGWHTPEAWTLPSAIGWLTANPDPMKLPVVPVAHGGRTSRLTLIRSPDAEGSSTARFVLRLWPADAHLGNGNARALWVGSVVEEQVSSHLSLLTLSVAQASANRPRQILAGAIDGRLAQRNHRAAEDEWDGRVLLAHEANASFNVNGQELGRPTPGTR